MENPKFDIYVFYNSGSFTKFWLSRIGPLVLLLSKTFTLFVYPFYLF